MNNDKRIREYARVYHPEAKVFLDYDLSIVQEIFDVIRNETGSLATSLLREYEYQLIEARRLEQVTEARRQEELMNDRMQSDLE